MTRRLLQVLVILNLVAGVLIGLLLAASLLAEGPVFEALGVGPGPGRSRLVFGMRLIAVLGLASVPLTHEVLSRLQQIVQTVSTGNPFVVANARRLVRVAWAVVGLELLHLAVGAAAATASSPAQPLDVDWSFSLTRWLAALLLFVLARVFEEGARMREDLEGTV